jgi:hypothetical protein
MKDRMMVSIRRRIMLDADVAKRRIRCASSWPAHQPRLWILLATSLAAPVAASQILRSISSSEKNHGFRFEGILKFVVIDAVGVYQQATNQRGFAIIDRSARQKTQKISASCPADPS